MSKAKTLIAILDDSQEIREMLAAALHDAGFDTRSYGLSREFEDAMPEISPDVCLIDLGLPDKDGLALVNRLALESGALIIIISGRAMLQDKIVGLELGADDYITKPFEAAEVVARIRALLRRNRPDSANSDAQMIRFNDWTVDYQQYQLTHDSGESKRLSHAEAQVLKVFLNAPNRLISREQILEQLGGSAGENMDRAIDVRVSRLRTKLNDDPQDPKIIKTIYGAGYIFIGDVRGAH